MILALRQFNSYYRYSPDRLFRDENLIGIRDFHELWKMFVPKPFASDRALSERVGTLCKFKHLTYNVKNVANPFEQADAELVHEYNRHNFHKQTRKHHGI